MLPFLQPKKLASVIIAKRKPEGSIEPMHAEDEHDPALVAAAEDLIRAVHEKNAEAVAAALQNAFEIVDVDAPAADDDEAVESLE